MDQENRKWENTEEHIKDAVNILQLLVEELAVNQDDPHIIRSVNVAVKILQAALSEITC